MCAGVQGGEERVAERKIAQGRAWEKLPLARAQERLSPITHYQLPIPYTDVTCNVSTDN
ncbi:hypothetical protein [Chroococcidiopsis cubana]|uniref:hypothetical protein n=1 Tax=Chroococcidiopsis cubana TaxID=171392 RepID=UPI00131503C9|nr:hypothetical protein [Chroococcidiopsis cubana]